MSRRLRVEIQGAVQGVGFRPLVYRMARELGLRGWVANDGRGVVIELEGDPAELDRFLERLPAEMPPPAGIQNQSVARLEPRGYRTFDIRQSEGAGEKTAQLLADIATCEVCLRELLDPADRRHAYPFTNCTHCGPRLTITRSLPYDRPGTSMRAFDMCDACRMEYEDPSNRRFHAQPNACPACGPRVQLWNGDGRTIAEQDAAMQATAQALKRGVIVAVKGIGGFHLMVDARNGSAIQRLREGKPRREKPFAVMVRDLEQARSLCVVDAPDEAILRSPEAPILLLPRQPDARVDDGVAPGNRRLGVMLPSTPLHHLLMRLLDFPVVATSGNLSEEPICTEEREAIRRLSGVAELFLVHDRPIVRHVDDSVVRVLDGEPTLLRRARGYAPRPVLSKKQLPTLLAVGAQLKNTVALSIGRQVFVSQHIGDMETPEGLRAFERVIEDFLRLYDARPVAVVHDLHPGYVSTTWAESAVATEQTASKGLERIRGLPLIPVQHHHAHLASCLAEHRFEGNALGVTWDGTGYGPDGTVWGGEFLVGDASGFRRAAHLRPFCLPGGEAAVREPRRSALALLWELDGGNTLQRDELEPVRSFTARERRLIATMLERGVNAPATTSAGRLFDGVAALLGLHQRVSFEGQAAMALEFVADPALDEAYPVESRGSTEPVILEWAAALHGLLDDLRRGVGIDVISARFHGALAEAILVVAQAVGEPTVALTGGCFQNQLLVERTARRLRSKGFRVLLHRQVPPNDGGVSLGQLAVGAAAQRSDTRC